MSKNIDYIRINKTAKTKKRISNAVLYTLLTIWAVMVLFPFYWMILTSVKGYGAYNSERIPQFFVSNPTLENY